MTHTPRHTRLERLGRRAFDRALAEGRGAMEATKARIAAEFGPAHEPNAIKILVDQMLELGATHPTIRLAYRMYARHLTPGIPITVATRALTQLYRRERDADRVLAIFNKHQPMRTRRSRAIVILARWLRRRRIGTAELGVIIGAVTHGGSPRRVRRIEIVDGRAS